MRNNKTKTDEEKDYKSYKYQSMGISLGMCFGISIGMLFGYFVFDNSALGMCIGLSAGMLMGMGVGRAMDNRINEQLEKGLRILDICRKESGLDEYEVKLCNKDGQEKIVTVTKENMDTDEFKIGDIVFMNEKGHILQFRDKREK